MDGLSFVGSAVRTIWGTTINQAVRTADPTRLNVGYPSFYV